MPSKNLLTITQMKFEKLTSSKLDRIYEFDGVILVKTKLDEIHSVELDWIQGRGNNYFFKIVGSHSDDYRFHFHPDDITHYALIQFDGSN